MSSRGSNLILILTLIYVAAISSVYAEEEAQGDAPMKAAAAEFSGATMLASSGTAPDATPGGGITGAMAPFLSESFQTDLATGAATMSVAITVSPGRKNMQPSLALSYSSNNSNGICGVGWAIPMNYIQRATKNGVPNYDDTDTFMFISSGSNAELVKTEEGQYRAKIESGFMKYVFDSTGNTWTVYDKTGTKYLFGRSIDTRLENEESTKTFGWYLDRVEDVYGNYITYIYSKPDDGQIYLNRIEYTGGVGGLAPDKSIEFDYDEVGEPTEMADKLYSYRSGWKIATTRRLASIRVVLGGALVWRYELAYTESPDTGRSLLTSVTVYDKDGISLPPKTFIYQRLE